MRLKIKCGNHWEMGAGISRIQGYPWLHSKFEDRQPDIHKTVLKNSKTKNKKTLQIKKKRLHAGEITQ